MALSFLGSLRAKAPASALAFANIQWGDSSDTAQKKLVAGGYVVDGVDQGDVYFHGSFAGYPVTGWVWLTQDKHPTVQKVSFTVAPEEADLFIGFDRVRRALVHQMGPTPHTPEIFEAPFTNGDGRVLEALRANKAIIGMFWREHEDNIYVGCVMRITPDLNIKIAFEGPGWQDELNRRNRLGIT
jgi:hypothetical protein